MTDKRAFFDTTSRAEDVYAEAVGTLLELRRALHKKEMSEPLFREAAIQAFVSGGETKTDALRKYKLDDEYARFSTELLEAQLSVERHEALVTVRKAQLRKWSRTKEVAK